MLSYEIQIFDNSIALVKRFNKECSSNINDVIRAILNFFFIKRFCTHKTHQKHQKHQKHKSTKTRPSKSTKRYKRTKIKNAHKKDLRRKSHLFAYLHFCVFCAREEKKMEKKKIEKREKSL